MINFFVKEEHYGVFPEPKHASKCIPEYYRDLKPEKMKGNPNSSTAKRCIPYMEAITAGYMIPLWVDMYVVAEDGNVDISFPEAMPMIQAIGTHDYEQLEKHPLSNTTYGKNISKFINPWTIQTPPGVSCLFTSPLNHFESRLKIIDGIVDTDTYYAPVNFPFVWTGGDGEFFIEKGTPLVHVIPFVRYDFNKSKVGIVDNKRLDKVQNKLGTMLRFGYKSYFWHKRKK